VDSLYGEMFLNLEDVATWCYESSLQYKEYSCAGTSVTFFLRYRLQPRATEAANQRARKSIERAAHVQFDQIFRRFSIHSVFSATLLLSITALFREPKAREDLQLDIRNTDV
jgi:hypothetical protein